MAFTVAMMTTSVVLLLVLQGFWLNSAYNDKRRDLERDVSLLFGNTIFDMSDSLMERTIKALPARDSGEKIGSYKTVVRSGKASQIPDHTMRVKTRVTRDSVSVERTFVKRDFHDSNKSIQVFLYSDKNRDSIKNYLRPLITELRGAPSAKAFTIELTGDSLRIKDIRAKFARALLRARIHLPDNAIRIMGITPENGPKKQKDAIITPAGAFTAEFVNINWVVLRKITPEIAFALLLTLITSASFIIMYKNLRAQQRLMILKNDFISNVTHELKTPIATVSVALEALKNFSGMDNPRLTHEYLDIAQHELTRLTVLTDKVLTTSLFDDGGVTMEMEDVNMEKILSDVIFAMGPVFEKNKGNIHFSKTGSDFSMRGSYVHLTNVVYNLLDNAVKYSPSAPTVDVSLGDQGDHISFSVTDSGSGIPEEYQARIFEKFFRLPTGDVHNVKGHGLGLSYVASVVSRHGGKISVSSKPGEGSTFTVVIPRNNA